VIRLLEIPSYFVLAAGGVLPRSFNIGFGPRVPSKLRSEASSARGAIGRLLAQLGQKLAGLPSSLSMAVALMVSRSWMRRSVVRIRCAVGRCFAGRDFRVSGRAQNKPQPPLLSTFMGEQTMIFTHLSLR
jgi:hypothetical protein